MSNYYYKYDYKVLQEGKIIEEHTLLSQSPVAATENDLKDEAIRFLKANNCLVIVDNIQEVKTQEEFFALGGSPEGILTKRALGFIDPSFN